MMSITLVRVNLDIKEKDFWNTLRFHTSSSLIGSLSRKSNKIVVLSHRGRPEGRDERLSFRPFVSKLEKKVGKSIVFFREHDFGKIRNAIDDAPGGSIFLLENLRFMPGEKKNSKSLGRQLAGLGDRFINNDFATAHHASASFVAITEFIPSKAGELLKNEIKTLSRARENSTHPFVLIVGGAKVKDKIGAINYLLPRADFVLLGGGAAIAVAMARGEDIGSSLYEPEAYWDAKRLAGNKKIISPLDYVRRDGAILDIGPKTRKQYASIIADARSIVWAGPMGYFEKKEFSRGTLAVARAVLKNKRARTVIGGAETVYSLPMKTTAQDHGNVFLSTGGSAMLHFMAGKDLPAMNALKSEVRN